MDSFTFLRIERTTKLGRLGEQLAEECLSAAGFTSVKNLNRGVNFPYVLRLKRFLQNGHPGTSVKKRKARRAPIRY
jgi:hypothetical protein